MKPFFFEFCLVSGRRIHPQGLDWVCTEREHLCAGRQRPVGLKEGSLALTRPRVTKNLSASVTQKVSLFTCLFPESALFPMRSVRANKLTAEKVWLVEN